MSEERCETCRFWLVDNVRHINECHRYAPGPHVMGQVIVWPDTSPDKWCGDYEARTDTPNDGE